VPEIPDIPDVPENPDIPDDVPKIPDIPDEPEIPDIPDEPKPVIPKRKCTPVDPPINSYSDLSWYLHDGTKDDFQFVYNKADIQVLEKISSKTNLFSFMS
jgi:hypothetical protein